MNALEVFGFGAHFGALFLFLWNDSDGSGGKEREKRYKRGGMEGRRDGEKEGWRDGWMDGGREKERMRERVCVFDMEGRSPRTSGWPS